MQDSKLCIQYDPDYKKYTLTCIYMEEDQKETKC